MQITGLNEIRKAFIDFYVERGHYHEKSASLIPKDDKSLLIINSGMAPLKKYFSGQAVPPSKRMVTCQKCIRTGDIENVGKTARHGTFFEMLGNFSFGDYFKDESLHWGWTFLTEVLGLPKDRFWATIYREDEEAHDIWRSIGLPEEHILRMGKEDNFWEIGLGPCGPDSEIFFDRGEEYGCGKADCKPGGEGDRFVEVWNHVFTQFSKEEDGSYSKLAHPNIDTGMGLERIACVMQNTDSIFDIDTIRYILSGVTERAGIAYEKEGTEHTDIPVRIITDHLRSMVFMIADGISPSNEGRGYVLRRLIRRASRYGKILGIEDSFLPALVDRVVHVSGDAYPEIREKKDFIKKIIENEEQKFRKTIDQGTEIINAYITEMKTKKQTVLDGEKTFKLYDTYGFPPELTEEILAEAGFTADKEGFRENMRKQRELARAGRSTADDEGWKERAEDLHLPATEFLGYHTLEADGKVLAITINGNSVSSVSAAEIDEKADLRVYLDKTPFYAQSGGQIYDNGFMSIKDLSLSVLSVTKKNGIFSHRISLQEGTLTTGMIVHASVDRVRRYATARNHSATHLLHQALREVLGEHVHQAGSFISDALLRFDFSHFAALSPEEILRVERIVNEQISLFLPVTTEEKTLEEAVNSGAMALFDEKYGDVVRVVSMGDFSKELCGGTHVSNTGSIGALRILSEQGVAAGTRRIEAVTGVRLAELLKEKEDILAALADTLNTEKEQLVSRAKSLTEEHRAMKKELKDFRAQALVSESTTLLTSAKPLRRANLITKKFTDVSVDDLRRLSDEIKQKAKSICMVFATVNAGKVVFLVSLTDDLVEKGLSAGKMIREIAKAAGGGGGGKAAMAQAGAKDPSKIGDAFALAETLLG